MLAVQKPGSKGLHNISGRTVATTDPGTHKEEVSQFVKGRVELGKMTRQFARLTGSGQGEFPKNLRLRNEKIPNKTGKLKRNLRQDKGKQTNVMHTKHMALDHSHGDIGVKRNSDTSLNLKDLSVVHAKALRIAVTNRMHGQRDEIRTVFLKMKKTRTGAGLQKILETDELGSDLLHRIFNAPNPLHTKDQMSPQCDLVSIRQKFCQNPLLRMSSMLDNALGGIRVRDHEEAD